MRSNVLAALAVLVMTAATTGAIEPHDDEWPPKMDDTYLCRDCVCNPAVMKFLPEQLQTQYVPKRMTHLAARIPNPFSSYTIVKNAVTDGSNQYSVPASWFTFADVEGPDDGDSDVIMHVPTYAVWAARVDIDESTTPPSAYQGQLPRVGLRWRRSQRSCGCREGSERRDAVPHRRRGHRGRARTNEPCQTGPSSTTTLVMTSVGNGRYEAVIDISSAPAGAAELFEVFVEATDAVTGATLVGDRWPHLRRH